MELMHNTINWYVPEELPAELEWLWEPESKYYWSSTTYVAWGIESVWVVDFAWEDGSRGGSNPTVNHFARVVRAF